jgi:hypothetical protein
MGGVYYLISWFVLHRLLRLDNGNGTALQSAVILLVLFMMNRLLRQVSSLLARILLSEAKVDAF